MTTVGRREEDFEVSFAQGALYKRKDFLGKEEEAKTHPNRTYYFRKNVDTDQLIPARFMSVPRSEGYGDYLLHDVRRDASGALRPEFPLNQAQQASVLVAGANFGGGSSREAALYALIDAG